MDNHTPSLAVLAAEYAEAEQTLRVIRERGDMEPEAEQRVCEARARLIEATHRETR